MMREARRCECGKNGGREDFLTRGLCPHLDYDYDEDDNDDEDAGKIETEGEGKRQCDNDI